MPENDEEERPLDERVKVWLSALGEGLHEHAYEKFGERLTGDMPALYALLDEAMEIGARAQRGDYDAPAGVKDTLEFINWCGALAVLMHERRAEHQGHYRSVDHGYWKPMFDQGLSPAAALEADMNDLSRRSPTPPAGSDPAAPPEPSLPAEAAPPPTTDSPGNV